MRRPLARSLAALSGALLLAAPVLAERPSINSINTELHRNRAAMCAKADADGDSYRPFVCDARCDCIPPDFIAELESCSETAPGSFVASQPDEVFSGSCVEAFEPNTCSGLFGGSALACSANSGNQCNTQADCESGATCVDLSGLGIPAKICLDPCSTNADCAPISLGLSCASSFSCTPFGCPAGWTCGAGGTCEKAGCTTDDDCDIVLQGPAASLVGVGADDSPDPVSCNVNGSSSSISSNDALECIAQIEAVTGACQ
jgi:hypothetical protein